MEKAEAYVRPFFAVKWPRLCGLRCGVLDAEMEADSRCLLGSFQMGSGRVRRRSPEGVDAARGLTVGLGGSLFP